MSSPSEDLLLLITETRKQLKHLNQLGVDAIVQSDAMKTVVESKPIPAAIKPGAAPTKQAPSVTLFGETAPAPESLPTSSETFEQIHAEIGDCVRCPLHQQRTHVVHTEGNRKARLMFVGEAPGADEDAQARPFVGKAGQLLTKIIEAIPERAEVVRKVFELADGGVGQHSIAAWLNENAGEPWGRGKRKGARSPGCRVDRRLQSS